jgi:hypothetical protein
MFRYRAEVLVELARHGVVPRSHTPPELVRGYVRDLYRYEIRARRGRMLKNEFPRDEYYGRVDAIRRKYPVLALLPRHMVE